ncbi:hypothetical protein GE09DRAFT_1226142 [Coniochaeta sp. 2T2.1]|nr:hypothetical protein GE09DRAFT_1226142 [Coniochaeta sp. 2T2.1]
MSSSSPSFTRPRASTALEPQGYQDSPLKPAPLRIPSKTRPSTPKLISRLSRSQRDGHVSASEPATQHTFRTTAPSLAGLVSKFEILDAVNKNANNGLMRSTSLTYDVSTPTPDVSPPAESGNVDLPEDLGQRSLVRKVSSGSISPMSKDSTKGKNAEDQQRYDPLLVAERRKLFETKPHAVSPKKSQTSTPSPHKGKLPVSKSKPARVPSPKTVVPDPTTPSSVETPPEVLEPPPTRPHTPKRVSISESADIEHPQIVKPRPDTPMPGYYPRKTPSVAHLRASFELVDDGSPRGRTGQEPVVTPRMSSNIHCRDWAVRDTTTGRGFHDVAGKRSTSRFSQMSPSPLRLPSVDLGDGRPMGPQLTVERYDITPSRPTPHIQKTIGPKIGHRRSGPYQLATTLPQPQVASPPMSGGSQSMIHPLLRQSQSVGNYLQHDTQTPQEVVLAQQGRFPSPTSTMFPPVLDHPLKVADLRKRYDTGEGSSSTAFIPFRRSRNDETPRPSKPRLASSTTSLVALSAAIGLATIQGGSKTPLPTTSHDHPWEGTSDRTSGPIVLNPLLIPKLNKKNDSPLKDKISLFESLTTPLPHGPKPSTTSTLRRRSGDVGAHLKSLAKTSTSQMWRRLSGSFDKSTTTTAQSSPSASSNGNDGPSTPRPSHKKPSKPTLEVKRKKSRGFEPRRQTHPTTARESTFFVQGTISRVPRGFVSRSHRPLTNTRDGRQAPSLPDLDFEVDGAADGSNDLTRWFEREFDVSFSFTGTSTSTGDDASGRVRGGSANNNSSDENRDRDRRRVHYRNPNVVLGRKTCASLVLSVRSARGRGSRPDIPPRNPARDKRRNPAWEAGKRRPPTPAPKGKGKEEGDIRDYFPVSPRTGLVMRGGNRDGNAGMNGVGGGDNADGDEEVVVSSAQCGLAHPRPSRVLDVRRFVGCCRDTGRRAAKL